MTDIHPTSDPPPNRAVLLSQFNGVFCLREWGSNLIPFEALAARLVAAWPAHVFIQYLWFQFFESCDSDLDGRIIQFYVESLITEIHF
jgi:hypothetical protein